MLLRDRLRNGGASQPFGEGDTPDPRACCDVLDERRAGDSRIVEYDYIGLRSPVDETRAALAYAAHPSK